MRFHKIDVIIISVECGISGQTKKLPELAAPAGNAESLRMALKFGADAVYLGLDQFNARMKADNFNIENLQYWIDYVHSKNAKIYLTFNTLIRQSELDGAARLAARAYGMGADAVILQDLGLLRAVRALNKDTVIHASTQAGVHNNEGALYLKELGASRVILSRETPLKDIAAVKRGTGLEVEVFVQGALCVSFSGNCYFSAAVSGRSGNRGMCMQLCRKKYTALAGPTAQKRGGGKQQAAKELSSGYLLSPSDLCLAGEIEKLIAAGVDSFKIEGRMRRPEYVGEAVRVYKKALAGALEKGDIDCLKSVFNRGDYSTGYLYPISGNKFIHSKLQGHKGLYAGNVVKVAGGYITADIAEGVEEGDAFKILRDGRETGNAAADKTQDPGLCRLKYLGNVKPGDKAHITTDIRQIKRLNEINP